MQLVRIAKWGTIGGISAALVIGTLSRIVGFDLPEQQRHDSGDVHQIGLAEAACQLAVEKTAHNPASIDWLRAEREFLLTRTDGSAAISRQPFRATNRLGATVRTVASCDLKRSGATWQVTSVREN